MIGRFVAVTAIMPAERGAIRFEPERVVVAWKAERGDVRVARALPPSRLCGDEFRVHLAGRATGV